MQHCDRLRISPRGLSEAGAVCSRHFALGCAGLLSLLASAGCGSRRAEWQIPPQLDPRAVTQAIMQIADGNGDGFLEEQELAAVPAMRDVRAAADSDHDGRLIASEIKGWLGLVKQESVGAREVRLKITRRGQPVADLLVKLVPEACMGGTIEPAEGVTYLDGVTLLNIPGRRTTGIRNGLYRVEITGTGPGGLPIPAKYNTASTLGLAVGGGLPQGLPPILSID